MALVTGCTYMRPESHRPVSVIPSPSSARGQPAKRLLSAFELNVGSTMIVHAWLSPGIVAVKPGPRFCQWPRLVLVLSSARVVISSASCMPSPTSQKSCVFATVPVSAWSQVSAVPRSAERIAMTASAAATSSAAGGLAACMVVTVSKGSTGPDLPPASYGGMRPVRGCSHSTSASSMRARSAIAAGVVGGADLDTVKRRAVGSPTIGVRVDPQRERGALLAGDDEAGGGRVHVHVCWTGSAGHERRRRPWPPPGTAAPRIPATCGSKSASSSRANSADSHRPHAHPCRRRPVSARQMSLAPPRTEPPPGHRLRERISTHLI